jgi:heme O synthase-like polyprenyltransferase
LRDGPRFDVKRWAKAVFALSIPYLTFLLVALLFDRRP